MDEESELRKLKWLLAALAVFLLTGWFAVGELRYAAFGDTAEATITESRESERGGRRGRTHTVRIVRYAFQDADGTTRTETDEVSPDWAPPAGGSLDAGEKVAVQYLSGVPDKSRLAGHSHSLPVAIFLACLAVILGFAVWLWRHARQAVHGGPARRRR